MRVITFFLFRILICVNPCFCSENYKGNDSIDFERNWAIGIVGSLDFYKYNFQNLEFTNTDLDHYYQKRYNHYSSGILLTKNISPILSFQMGLIYAEKGFNRITNPNYYTNEWQIKEMRFYAYFIETLIAVQFNFYKKNNWRFGINTGGNINIPVRGSIHLISILGKDDNEIIANWDWNWTGNNYPNFLWKSYTTNSAGKIHTSAALSPFCSFNIKKGEFIFSPFYQYYFINIYEYRLTQKASSFSIMLGFNYWL